MPEFITRCPHCSTSFRTNADQLAAASGKVRCGACLNIFLASEHIVQDDPAVHWEMVEEPTSQAETAPPADSVTDEDESQPLFSALDQDWEEEQPEPASSEPRQTAFEGDDFDDIRAAAFKAELDDSREAARFSADNLAALKAIPNPLELEWFKRSHPGLIRTVLSMLAAILLTGLLGVQWLWSQKTTLSQNPDWRPRLETFCSLLPCSLEPLTDLSAIASSDLVVRSHPRAENALQVNLNFQNNAAFAQPYPALTLRFTDEQQKLVAMRSFTPAEYLPAGLRLMQEMPPATSIQAELEIVDPGPEAINYEILLGSQQR